MFKSDEVKLPSDEIVRALNRVGQPATLVNLFSVEGNANYIRLVMGEVSSNIPPQPRITVVIPIQNALELAELLLRITQGIQAMTVTPAGQC